MATDTATGAAAPYLRDCPDCEQIMTLIRIGVAFKAQQCGRRHGFLHRYVVRIVQKMVQPITFASLLAELDLAAARRAASDGRGEPVERVSRTWEQLTFHDPQRGRQQIAFGTLRNILTSAKKAKFSAGAKS